MGDVIVVVVEAKFDKFPSFTSAADVVGASTEDVFFVATAPTEDNAILALSVLGNAIPPTAVAWVLTCVPSMSIRACAPSDVMTIWCVPTLGCVDGASVIPAMVNVGTPAFNTSR